MAGVLSTVSGAMLDRPRPAYGAVFAGTLVVAAVLLATKLLLAARRPLLRAGLVSAGLVAALLSFVPAVTETRARASVWSDQDRAWAKILAISPASEYRWDYAVGLKAQNRLAEYRDQVQIYFERNGGDPRRRLDFALALLQAGDEDRAFSHLVALKNKPLPSSVEDATRVLELLERRGAFDLAFDLVERVPALPEAVQVRMATKALEQKRKETFATLRTRLLALPRPPLAAFELAYRDAWARQDVELLQSIGERATTLYPDAAVGYAAQGKIAKIYRRDDEMLAWHEKALAREKSLADLHYDMGLVLHGRADRLLEAATHYEKVLELCPDHPRRSTIEGWIQALRTEAKANGG
jgi:tetratricopeptide (TPR) repeat protein